MKVVIIPSAKTITNKNVIYEKLPSVMFPIGGVPVLELLVNKYKNAVDQIVVLSHEANEIIDNYIADKKLPVDNYVVPYLKDLKTTVTQGIEYVLKKYGECEIIINFGDTIVEDAVPEDSVFYSDANTLTDEWTYFSVKNNAIDLIYDKVAPQNKNQPYYLFVGVFSFKESALLLKLLNSHSFFDAIKEYGNLKCLNIVKVQNWLDTGHADKCTELQLSVKTRVFNHVSIDSHRGILTKTSNDFEKFIGEIKWYLSLPKQLQYLVPRVFDYSFEDLPYISLEYYAYSTIHDIFLYAYLDENKWKKIFESIKFLLFDMSKFKKEVDSYPVLKKVYIDKTVTRLNRLRADNAFKDLFVKTIIINDVKYFSIDKILEKIQSYFDSHFKEKIDFCIIHGDMCFANMLIDDSLSIIKLIDPRGDFGGYSVYGDQRYELAKLFHCLDGLYDYIIKDMFYLKYDGDKFDYSVVANNGNLFDLFVKEFADIIGDNFEQIEFIEALLFLSMIPLHSENVLHQYAMLCTAIRILNRIMDIEEK